MKRDMENKELLREKHENKQWIIKNPIDANNEKEQLIMKKDMENKELLREKHENKQEIIFKKIIDANNELKLNVNEQQDK